jgi:prevent-host-death family protein
MTTIAATDAKNRFGELLEAIHREPVAIAKKGRTVAVVLSIEDYTEMQQKISGEFGKTDFSGIEAWVKDHSRVRTGKTVDEEDYRRHLDEKYGS